MKPPVPRDPWARLADLTPARIAIGRTGASLPTREVLAFALDHARARDAVHTPFDAGRVAADIEAMGLETLVVASQASDRPDYLRRPDLGRRLTTDDAVRLDAVRRPGCDLAFVVADGLSSAAAHAHAAALVAALLPAVAAAGWRIGPVVVARNGRVALGDEVGERLDARLTLVLIGERPGLSSPDSLGAYLTLSPRVGTTDAARNCVSNIRGAGLSYDAAAFKIAWLAREAFRLGQTGVALKDESHLDRLPASPAPGGAIAADPPER